jgi:hypothetical protein
LEEEAMSNAEATSSPAAPAWVKAADGYSLALDGDGKLVGRNAAGKQLASVPKKIKDSEPAAQLLALREWLGEHERECADLVDAWMIRSLPVPRAIVEAVWPDSAWRTPLENAIVWPIDARGVADAERVGFLKGADPKRGVGVVSATGESVWIAALAVAIPHPILIAELDDFRELVTELQLKQGLSQLFRETWTKPADLDPEATSIDQWGGGEFEMLAHAVGRARSKGYRVSGGYAVCPVREGESTVEARYWIGAEYDWETATGELIWVDSQERRLKVADVGPVAFSEGMRMASIVYAGRKVEEEGEED